VRGIVTGYDVTGNDVTGSCITGNDVTGTGNERGIMFTLYFPRFCQELL
jgi:hypothetical protein